MLHLSLPGLSGGTPLTIVANLIAGSDELTGSPPALSETCTYKIIDTITKLIIELPADARCFVGHTWNRFLG